MKKRFKKYILITIIAILIGTIFCACAPTLSDGQTQAIIDEAVAIQTDGDVYKADDFTTVFLKKGDTLYGMLPGQSAFYTNKATVDKANNSYTKMYELLQMVPHAEFGYRTQLGEYKVLEDMWVATGVCLANKEIGGVTAGEGGGTQYVIPEYETKLELITTTDIAE